MIQVYFDESGEGKDPACRFLGMAGIVAHEAEWPLFCASWNAVLAQHEIPHFHASHCEHNRGQFKDKAKWDRARRLKLTGQLLDAIATIKPRIIGAAVDLTAWRLLPEDDETHFHSPWMCCVQECARLASVFGIVDEDAVQVIFSQQNEYSPIVRQFWEVVRASKREGYHRFEPFSMQDMRSVPQLQAADLIVYEITKGLPQWEAGGSVRAAFPTLIDIDPDAFIAAINAEHLQSQLEGFRRFYNSFAPPSL